MRKLVPLLFVLLTGCYKATVNTGLAPNAVVHTRWAHSWIGGLVPPAAFDAVSLCPNGVSRVETELSPANQLVNVATFGIYTPMTMRAVCAM